MWREGNTQRWKFIAATILFLVATILCLRLVASAQNIADPFELATTNVTILNPDNREVIGHGRYTVTHAKDALLLEGENRYFDGEYDREVQRVEHGADGAPPILISYEHSFFAADGSPQSLDTLDARTGIVACTHYGAGAPDLQQSKVEVPPDTYAGSSQLMLLIGRLRERAQDLSMHSFICFPGPRIVAIKVTAPSSRAKWPMYPGDLVKLELAPDLGWLGALAAPFIPKAYGWFDPDDNFNYVGGLFDRFYRRRHLMMVRTRRVSDVVQNQPSSRP